MDQQKITNYIFDTWDKTIIPTLEEYIRIPNKSPNFDPQWKENGYMDKAVELMANWCKEHPVEGMQLEVVSLEGRTPVIMIEVPGKSDQTVLLYGHLDKQPEMVGWEDELGPWKPVIRDEKLYGRGGADDGYAIFASLTAIKALQEQQVPHARCVILIEGCEESGSFDLPYYVDHLKDRIGKPNLVVCLDSGCGNYEQMWVTTSLRGLVSGNLKVDVLTEGVHSGSASGIVPSSFRILRQLLSRIEDQISGEILLDDLKVDIPQQRLDQSKQAAKVLGKIIYEEFPFYKGVQPLEGELDHLVLNRTWRSTLSTVGVEGIPALKDGGNVLRPSTTLKLSVRIPPTCSPEKAAAALKETLETNPPYQANVVFEVEDTGPGWNAPAVSDWLAKATEEASNNFFGKPAVYLGEGGSIPFMGMLGEKFPEAQFLITGLLGPKSNAHGPNEFLHIPTGKKLTCCISHILMEHFKTFS